MLKQKLLAEVGIDLGSLEEVSSNVKLRGCRKASMGVRMGGGYIERYLLVFK